MLKTKSTTETMGSSEISDQNDGLEGFNELEPTLPPRRKGSLRKAALEAAAEHGERDEDAPKRKRGRPKADNPFSVVFRDFVFLELCERLSSQTHRVFIVF